MRDINIEIANKVSATMRENRIGFVTAFTQVMNSCYPSLDWATTKIAVGGILGKRKRRPRKKKIPASQLAFLFDKETVRDAKKCEESLLAGIPPDDR